MLKALLKVRIKAVFAAMFTRASKSKKRSVGSKIGLTLLMVYAFGCLMVAAGMLCKSMLPLVDAGLGWFYFAVMALTALMFCILGGSFAAKTQIFEAKDNELLLSMPIPTSYILLCRILPLLVLNMIYAGLFLLPACVIYGFSKPLSVLGIIAMVVGSLLIIVLGTAVSMLLGWLISILTARSRHKSLIGTVISLVFLGAYFYFYSNISKYVGMLVARGEEFGSAIRHAIPFVYYYGEAITKGDLLALLLLTAWCMIPAIIAFLLLRANFIQIMTMKRGAAHIRYHARAMSAGSPFSALFKKECRRFFTTTAYLMNSGIGAIMMVGGAIYLVLRGPDMFSNAGMVPSEFLVAIMGAAFCFCAVTITPTSVSISLEGPCFPMLRAMPLRIRDVFGAKIAVALVIGLPACLISGVVVGVMLSLSILTTLVLILLPAALLTWMAVFGLMVNLRHPKLDWISEAVVIKQSGSAMITMLCGMAFILTPGLLYVFVLSDYIGVMTFFWVMTGVFALLAALGWNRLLKKGDAILQKL